MDGGDLSEHGPDEVAAAAIEAHSAAFLPETSLLRRTPRAPERQRDPAFFEAFDDLTLVYDCFWHRDGNRILMVGPPPLNLVQAVQNANFYAEPSGKPLLLARHDSLSVTIYELIGPPADTTHVRLGSGDVRLPVMPNHSRELAGSSILFSMNKDNDLAWIRQWAHHHARHQGTDTVILYDNGSTRYALDELRTVLREVPGIGRAIVPSWPYRFGAYDTAVRNNPYWSRFLQNASMSVILRRYGAFAKGLLNLDVDELAAPSAVDLYTMAERSMSGLLTFKGRWVEPVATPDGPPDHRAFTKVMADEQARLCRNSKWVLDPKRRWLDRLNAHPYWHFIAGRPFWVKRQLRDMQYWHFRAISTNWKEPRTEPRDGAMIDDERLVAAFREGPSG